jgi:hypothetical protein
MQIETQGLKNKVSKIHGPKRCLTLKFFGLVFFLIKYAIVPQIIGKKKEKKKKKIKNKE